jgi:hypothetical protein
MNRFLITVNDDLHILAYGNNIVDQIKNDEKFWDILVNEYDINDGTITVAKISEKRYQKDTAYYDSLKVIIYG